MAKAKTLASLVRAAVQSEAAATFTDVGSRSRAAAAPIPSPEVMLDTLIGLSSAATTSSTDHRSHTPCSTASTYFSGKSLPDVSTKRQSKEISSILFGPDSGLTNGDKPLFSSASPVNVSIQRKGTTRERKLNWAFKSVESTRFQRLVRMCAHILGMDNTLKAFGKLGIDTGVKEYNALIRLCIERAKSTEAEEVSLQQIYMAFQLFNSMREQGFQIQDETYGPFLMFLCDMGMVEEFQLFSSMIKGENPSSVSRIGYYEMLLWIKVNNKEKIQELCNYVAAGDGGDTFSILENYLLALCESDRKDEVLQLLEIVDIAKVTSVDSVTSIFKSLGRMGLESFAEKFILALKNSDYGVENISHVVFDYAVSIPNLAVEDVALKFKMLHEKFELAPPTTSYERLTAFCCDSHKVCVAFDIVHQMCGVGIKLSVETLSSLLHACEDSCEFSLVPQIYALLHRHNLKPTYEIFRSMIKLRVKMNDFDAAFGMLEDLKKMNLMATSSLYNAILGGYFREKNTAGVMKTLKQMEEADVKPNSETFCYLIGNCNCEEDIAKYYGELKNARVQVSKHIFMALITAYAACGQFEKAKQVILEDEMPIMNLNEVRGFLVSALAYNGQMSDALDIYKELKQAGCDLDPKAIISFMEPFHSAGELDRLFQILHELKK